MNIPGKPGSRAEELCRGQPRGAQNKMKKGRQWIYKEQRKDILPTPKTTAPRVSPLSVDGKTLLLFAPGKNKESSLILTLNLSGDLTGSTIQMYSDSDHFSPLPLLPPLLSQHHVLPFTSNSSLYFHPYSTWNFKHSKQSKFLCLSRNLSMSSKLSNFFKVVDMFPVFIYDSSNFSLLFFLGQSSKRSVKIISLFKELAFVFIDFSLVFFHYLFH